MEAFQHSGFVKGERAEEGAGSETGGFSRNSVRKHPFSCVLVFVFSRLCHGECLGDFKQKTCL